jgi:hypothetical protein
MLRPYIVRFVRPYIVRFVRPYIVRFVHRVDDQYPVKMIRHHDECIERDVAKVHGDLVPTFARDLPRMAEL